MTYADSLREPLVTLSSGCWAPLSRSRAALVGLCFLVAGACRLAERDPEAELSDALDAAYPLGWRYATLSNFGHSELQPGESPAWVRGDFDGDEEGDYAAQVVVFKKGHTSAIDSAQLIVALLRRGPGFEPHLVTIGGGPQEGVYLGRLPRGHTVTDAETRTEITLPFDAVHQVFAGQASVAYVYESGRWVDILTGD